MERTTRTFQCTPSVAITQKRSRFASPNSTSAGTAIAATNERCSASTSTTAPTRMAACSATIAPKIGSGSGAAPVAASARWCRRDSDSSTRRQAPTAATSAQKRRVEVRASAPLQQQQLRRKAGPEGGQNSVRVGRRAASGQPPVEHEEDRRARLVAEVAQHVPGRLRVVALQAQFLFDKSQDLAAPRVQHEAAQLLTGETAPVRELPHQARDLGLDQPRHVLGQDRMEAVVLQIEPQRVGGLREEVAEGFQDSNPPDAARRTRAAAFEQRRGRAVAEERRRNQVRERQIGALDAEARELDG